MLSLWQLLVHPWLTSASPAHVMSSEYTTRIRSLALRQKMKKFFVDNSIEVENKVRREDLKHVIGSLSKQELSKQIEHIVVDKMKSLAAGLYPMPFNIRLIFYTTWLNYISLCLSVFVHVEGAATAAAAAADSSSIEIDMPMFFQLLQAANLPDLAVPAVFNIFDLDKNGSISMKEFLFTLLALRPPENGQEEVCCL